MNNDVVTRHQSLMTKPNAEQAGKELAKPSAEEASKELGKLNQVKQSYAFPHYHTMIRDRFGRCEQAKRAKGKEEPLHGKKDLTDDLRVREYNDHLAKAAE